jgi:hypothetical protein
VQQEEMMRFTAVRVFEDQDFWVYVPDGYDIEPKEIPEPPLEIGKREDIHWFGNFRLVKRSDKTPDKLYFKYEILVLKKEGMNELVFWDGRSVVTLSEDFHDFREIVTPSGIHYLRAKLTLTDPACGWR